MKILKSFVAVVLLSSLGTAQAQTGKPAANAADKKICRDVGPPTGSILSRKRDCHTRAEWAEIDKARAADVDQFQINRDRSMGARRE